MEKRGADRELPGQEMAHAVIIYLVALLVTLPLFIILYPYVPELRVPPGFRVDHLLTFAVLLIALIILVRRFQMMVYVLLVVGAVAITITGLGGGYGFRDLYGDYAMFLHSLRNTTVHVPLAGRNAGPVRDAEGLRRAADPEQPGLRAFAVRLATEHFTEVPVGQEDLGLVRAFSVFRSINSNWRYVADPEGREYIAPAMESAELMAGDCDDHAVLMAACIEAVGGRVRLVRTTGHIYPELYVGGDKELERAAFLVRRVLFRDEVGDKPLYHHTDADGAHWLNLDYTRDHPGGELMDERILGILVLGNTKARS